MKKNIEVRSGFWPMNELKYFKSKTVDINNNRTSRKMFEKTLVLPSSIHLNKREIVHIRDTILSFINKI